MRTKFLSIITCFIFVSFAISACLDSDNDYQYSSDATVHAFSLDTIHGKDYLFTIDQLKKIIYNRDSMPMGADTILDRILVDTFTVTGWVTSQDTLFSTEDSVDLRGAINNEEGLKFKVYAADGLTSSLYTLKINVHQQDPDSLVWNNMQEVNDIFSTTTNEGAQKAILWNSGTDEELLLVYTSNTQLYQTSTAPGAYAWSEETASGLPENVDLTTLICCENTLYVLAEGDVYTSDDATTWSKSEGLSGNIKAFTGVFPENTVSGNPATLAGIQEVDGKLYFCTVSYEDQSSWTLGEEVPEGFPTYNINYTALTTATGVNKVVAVGMPTTIPYATVPWFSMNGSGWASLENNSYETYCINVENPSIIYYGGNYYVFGGRFYSVQTSVTGIAWFTTEEKFLLPDAFRNKGTSYSLVVDSHNYIWIVWGGNGIANEVWQGRLNRLGFAIQ